MEDLAKMTNRNEIDAIVGRVKTASRRINTYADAYERSGVADIKKIQLFKDEIEELDSTLAYWLTYLALGGDIDNE